MEDRPETLPSKTTKIKTGYGNLYVNVTFKEDKPFEVFAFMGKSGGSLMAKSETIGRLCSLALRNSIPLEDIIKQLKDIMDDKPLYVGKGLVKSIPDAIAQVLEKYIKEVGSSKKKEKSNLKN